MHLLTCFPGWTWEYIDAHMTFSRLDAMRAYWRDHPPLHLLVEAWLGVKPEAKPEAADLDALFALFPTPGLNPK